MFVAPFGAAGVFTFLGDLLEADMHAKRIMSLANATLGVMVGAPLAVASIGHALADARGLLTKNAIKQVDRLLSNRAIDVWALAAPWVREVIGSAKHIVVAMDWTDFDADDQTTLALNLVTTHGRATPLLWLTVMNDDLHDQRSACEDACLKRLAEFVPAGVKVTILADRGFGDTKDLRFGMGLATQRISRPDRRDRLLLISAFAVHLMSLLGMGGEGESLGMDRHLKSNTSKKTHPFAVSSGLHALRPHSHHAGHSSRPTHAAFLRNDSDFPNPSQPSRSRMK